MTHAAFAMHASHINAPAQPIADGEAEGLAELQRALAPDESLLDVLQRASREQVHTGFALLDRALSLRPGRVLELAGPAGCGKSELLLQVCTAGFVYAACRWHCKGLPWSQGCRHRAHAATDKRQHTTHSMHSMQWPTAVLPSPPCKPAHMLLCAAFLCCASDAQVCVRCLLLGRGPQSQGQGGYQGGHVVLLDLDAKFDMIRMIKVGEHCNHGQLTRRVKGARRSRGNRVTGAVATAGRMAKKKFAWCLKALQLIVWQALVAWLAYPG